jgi:NitT/TauT family transport system substrate-binding protein
MMAKRRARLLTAGLLGLSVTACGALDSPNSAEAGSTNKIRLEVLTSGLATTLTEIAKAVNAYEREGISVEMVDVPSGDSTVAVQELLQGRVDAAYVNTESVLTLDSAYVAKGEEPPLVAVAATGQVTNLVLSKEVPYTGLEDLHGLSIGVSSLQSLHRATFDYYLSQQGMSEDDLDIKFVELDGSDMPSALASNQIDGFLHSEPTTAIALQQSNAQLAIDVAGSVNPIREAAANVIAVRTDYLESNREQVEKLVAAMAYASDQFPAFSVPKLAQIYARYTDSPVGLMTEVARQKDYYDPTLRPLRAAADAFWKVHVPFLLKEDLVSRDIAKEQVFDFSFDEGSK